MIVRVEVDRDLCCGHGVCADEAPAVFEVDDDAKVRVRFAEVPPEQLDAARAACVWCPTLAIRLVEG